MNNKRQLWIQILFYGAIWGLLEATLGHVLHFIPATIAGSIMFPIASVILYKAYERTNNIGALIAIGAVAATIKSVDFLLPALSIYKTINPMMSILMESLVVVVVIGMVTSQKQHLQYSGWMTASVSWRVLFIGWMGLQFLLTGNLAPYLTNMALLVEFVIIQGVVSGLLAIGFIVLSKQVHVKHRYDQAPLIASTLFVVACLATYLL